MSRSKHTRPKHIRAADRVRSPYQSRGTNEQGLFNRIARKLKEDGVSISPHTPDVDLQPIFPRIKISRPRTGYLHPASKKDIMDFIEFFGEECFYGVKSIKLMQCSELDIEAGLLIASLRVPGIIVLYEQAEPPWLINGILPETQKRRMELCGAGIESVAENTQTVVHWSSSALKYFMLFEGLMHELGHHMMQQYSGKRNTQIIRTVDHEKFAAMFVHRCRCYYEKKYGAFWHGP